jgi:hypothetical protein
VNFPDDVVREFAETLRAYRISSVVGDRYAGEWPRERFRVHGVAYEPSANAKSDLYTALLPLLKSGRVELLNDKCLAAQHAHDSGDSQTGWNMMILKCKDKTA